MDKFYPLFISWVAAVSAGLLIQNGCIMYSHMHLFSHSQRGHIDLIKLRLPIVWFRKYIALLPVTHSFFTSAQTQGHVSGRQIQAFHPHSNCTVNHKQLNVFRNVASSKGHMSAFCQMSSKHFNLQKQTSQRRALILSHHSSTLLLHLNAPLGRGRKGLHLFSWNALDYCVPFDCKSPPERTNTVNLCSGNCKGPLCSHKRLLVFSGCWFPNMAIRHRSPCDPRILALSHFDFQGCRASQAATSSTR